MVLKARTLRYTLMVYIQLLSGDLSLIVQGVCYIINPVIGKVGGLQQW